MLNFLASWGRTCWGTRCSTLGYVAGPIVGAWRKPPSRDGRLNSCCSRFGIFVFLTRRICFENLQDALPYRCRRHTPDAPRHDGRCDTRRTPRRTPDAASPLVWRDWECTPYAPQPIGLRNISGGGHAHFTPLQPRGDGQMGSNTHCGFFLSGGCGLVWAGVLALFGMRMFEKGGRLKSQKIREGGWPY